MRADVAFFLIACVAIFPGSRCACLRLSARPIGCRIDSGSVVVDVNRTSGARYWDVNRTFVVRYQIAYMARVTTLDSFCKRPTLLSLWVSNGDDAASFHGKALPIGFLHGALSSPVSTGSDPLQGVVSLDA